MSFEGRRYPCAKQSWLLDDHSPGRTHHRAAHIKFLRSRKPVLQFHRAFSDQSLRSRKPVLQFHRAFSDQSLRSRKPVLQFQRALGDKPLQPAPPSTGFYALLIYTPFITPRSMVSKGKQAPIPRLGPIAYCFGLYALYTGQASKQTPEVRTYLSFLQRIYLKTIAGIDGGAGGQRTRERHPWAALDETATLG